MRRSTSIKRKYPNTVPAPVWCQQSAVLPKNSPVKVQSQPCTMQTSICAVPTTLPAQCSAKNNPCIVQFQPGTVQTSPSAGRIRWGPKVQVKSTNYDASTVQCQTSQHRCDACGHRNNYHVRINQIVWRTFVNRPCNKNQEFIQHLQWYRLELTL